MKKKLILAGTVLMGAGLALVGCGDSSKTSDGKTRIEMVQYKPEAVKAFEKMEEKFNETHDDIELTIESPNEAMTILKTRFIKEDQPDIIGIGDAAASLISPAMFEEFAFPYQKRIVEAVHRAGARTKLHICGNTSAVLPQMIETGSDTSI